MEIFTDELGWKKRNKANTNMARMKINHQSL